MKSLRTLSAILSLAAIFMVNNASSQNEAKPAEHFDSSPLEFIENAGQWHENVLFKTFFEGRNELFLEESAFTYVLTHPEDLERFHDDHRSKPTTEPKEGFIRHHAYRVSFVGANGSEGKGIAKKKAYHNYYLGNDPAKWTHHVSMFGKVFQQNIYEGIHLETYSQQGRLKYDLLVQPGADASKIKLNYEGADRLEIVDGALHVHTSVQLIKEMAPVAWQQFNDRRVEVECEYALEGNELTFVFPNGYDPEHELVIDPTVVAATLTGSSSDNYGHTATFDNGGNVYGGGISFGTGYQITTGAFQTSFGGGFTDMGISKYTPNGDDLIYATYIGGNGEDYPHSLITDFNQQLYVYGSSNSQNYPTSVNAVQNSPGGGTDIVVTILNSDGSALVGSSYFGGNNNDGWNESFLNSNYGDTYRGEIVLDNQNNVYVISSTSSNDFPVTANAFQGTKSGGQDAVVFKANSDLSLVYWSTYLGSSDPDIGNGIRVTDNQSVYVTGTAGDSDFPTTPGTNQATWPGGQECAYLVKFSPDGSTMSAGTFFGTSDGDEHAFFVDIDEDDQVHIFGQTTGTVPITPGTYSAAPGSRQFLVAFNADLDAVVYSTVIGTTGGGYDFVPVAFMVDKCNGIYFSGYQAGFGLPVTPDAISTQSNSFYLAKLTPNATDLDFGTYYGAADHVDGGTSRFDKGGVVYQGVCSCSGSVLNTLPNAWATTQSGFCDVGVFKINFDIETTIANGIALPSTSGCAPYTVDFEFTGTNATTWEWSIGGTVISNSQNHTYTFDNAGAYDVQLVVTNPSACNPLDTLNLQIDVLDGESTMTDTSFCGGNELFLDATTANATYEWQDGSTAAAFVVTNPGIYWVDVAIDGCTRRDSFNVVADSGVSIDLGPDQSVCDVPTITLDVENDGVVSYVWQDGSTDPTFLANSTGIYTVEVVDTAGCIIMDEIDLVFGNTPSIQIEPDTTLCDGETLTLTATFSSGDLTWQDGSTGPTFTVTEAGEYWAEADDEGCIAFDTAEVAFLPPLVPNETGIDILCANDCNGMVTATPFGGSGSNYEFSWDTGDMTPMVDSLCPGDYSVTVTDDRGCTGEATASVGAPEILEMSLTTQDVECPGDDDGAIEVTVATGGTPPYMYSFAGGDFIGTNGVGQLPGGEYAVVLQDDNGCTLTEVGTIEEPSGFAISAGDDIEIQLGESTQLNSLILPFNDQTILWSPDDFLECTNCPDPSLAPTETTEYQLLVTDQKSGCFQLDTVLVLVAKPRDVYIPNAFSPNGDGVNDVFTVFTGIGVERVRELLIFDRWGELMFENYTFPPNQLEYGWDGTFRGDELNPAVFVYAAYVEFKDGEVLFFEGDITLLR